VKIPTNLSKCSKIDAGLRVISSRRTESCFRWATVIAIASCSPDFEPLRKTISEKKLKRSTAPSYAVLDATHVRIQYICSGGDDHNDGARSAAYVERYKSPNRTVCAPRVPSHRTSHISSPPPIAKTATRMQKSSCNDPIPARKVSAWMAAVLCAGQRLLNALESMAIGFA